MLAMVDLQMDLYPFCSTLEYHGVGSRSRGKGPPGQ